MLGLYRNVLWKTTPCVHELSDSESKERTVLTPYKCRKFLAQKDKIKSQNT